MFYQTFAINESLYCPRFLLRVNDDDSATHAVNSGHLGYSNFYVRTPLIPHAIQVSSFHDPNKIKGAQRLSDRVLDS